MNQTIEMALNDAGQWVMETAEDGLSFLMSNANAAIDLTEVETSLTAAQTSGESVGTLVIGVVAGLVVVGIIIGMVKKL